LQRNETLPLEDNEGENGDYLFPEIDDASFEETMDSAIAEIMEKHRSENDDESIEKAVSTESVSEAKRRGLVPQSGDWQKPGRWVRPKDADVPVDEGEKPRKKATIRSSKRMTVIGEGVEETLKDIFHEDFKLSDFEDMYSTGLRDFSTEIIGIHTNTSPNPRDTSKGISIHIAIHLNVEEGKPVKEVGKMRRTFRRNGRGKLIVTHQSFALNPSFQNQGVASDMLENVEKEYEKHGVWGINLTANADIGGYAWARQGYDFTSDKDREKIRKYFVRRVTELHKRGKISDKDLTPFLEAIDSFEHSWEFASWNPKPLPPGKFGYLDKLGKTMMLGRSWGAGKRLDKKSQGYQRGKIYFALKRKHNEQG